MSRSRFLLPVLVLLLVVLTAACSARRVREDAEPAESSHSAAANSGRTNAKSSATARQAGGKRSGQAGAHPDNGDGVSVLFIGNSFTLEGPVADLVAEFAKHSGFVNVTVDTRAVRGQSLAWHRADRSPEGASARLREGWDVVVLQDFSTRPTDALGEPERFKEDVTWFYERAKEANSQARVVLYETWARRLGHAIYQETFSGPAQMQDQLRRHYTDAAERYVPRFATVAPGSSVQVAPVGDAWELQLSRDDGLRLHAADDYHANPAGEYLNAAVLFSTIFDRPAAGLPSINVSSRTAAKLQATADAITGRGTQLPGPSRPAPTDSAFNAA